MKKTYITPEALTISLATSLPLAAISGHNEQGDGNQLVKEQVDYDADGGTGSGKNIWDEEW